MDFTFLDGKSNEEIKKYIDDNTDKIKELAFYFAGNGNLDLVKYLVEHGADVNAKNDRGETILSNACKDGNIDLVKYLVEHEADINDRDIYGKTSFLYACEKGNLYLIKYLVDSGANINTKFCFIVNDLLFNIFLLSGHINLKAEDIFKGSLLSFTKKYCNKEIIDYLISKGARE